MGLPHAEEVIMIKDAKSLNTTIFLSLSEIQRKISARLACEWSAEGN